MREKLIELLNASFEAQYSKRGLLTAPHTAADLIANGVTLDNQVSSNKWIPVTERLPEYFGTFIVVITDTDGTHTDAADFDPFEKKWLPSACYSKYYKVTHWMPLPEPPKGE